MRKDHISVITAFKARDTMSGSYNPLGRCRIHTDGRALYSYGKPIAYRRNDGTVELLDQELTEFSITRKHIQAVEKMIPDAEIVQRIQFPD